MKKKLTEESEFKFQMESNSGVNFELEQYKTLIQIYNEEVTRFYSRQNIYITFQLIVFAGIVSGIDKLLKYPLIFRFGVLLMIIISFFSILLSKRGYDIQNIIIKTIEKFEKENKKLKLLKTIYESTLNSKFTLIKKLNFQSLASLVFSILIFFFWLLFWLFVDFFCGII